MRRAGLVLLIATVCAVIGHRPTGWAAAALALILLAVLTVIVLRLRFEDERARRDRAWARGQHPTRRT